MKPENRAEPAAKVTAGHVSDEKHLTDYLRVLYKRRWVALPVFLIAFVAIAVNSLRETPIYQARAQLLIEKDGPNVARLDQMFQSQEGWYTDEFYQTQHRILQSRSLAKRTLQAMKLWGATSRPSAVEEESFSLTDAVQRGISALVGLVKKPADAETPAPETARHVDETVTESDRIDGFLGGLSIVPVRNTRMVEIRYSSADPAFAAAAANAVAKTYIDQTLELKFTASKEAADWLADRLTEQRQAVEVSEAALQAFRERHGAISVADNSSSNIVLQRLVEVGTAHTKAKTERIQKEALYNQLKAIEATGGLDTFPAVLSNEFIQKIKAELADLQRQEAQLAERYGPRNPEMIKLRTAIETTDAKLRGEVAKVVESVRNEYLTAQAQERSLESTLETHKTDALSLNRTGIEYGVLQREAESNRQIYESLMQRTKETGLSSELRTTNVRIVDPAERPRSPISPNIRRDLMIGLLGSLVLAVGLAFFFEYLDNRIKTPQELKANLGIPFLGMVPELPDQKKGGHDPLLNNGVPANFAEAFKTVRTNVLFSSADEGMRSLVVTSAGPGEGKSLVASNLAIALAQADQRVLLIDADMRRPRVHEIFQTSQEPGLSNVLTNNATTSEAIRTTTVHGLSLLHSGHVPPNPAELLGSRRYIDFMASLSKDFDWVVIDTPPVMVVTDASIVANQASGVVFVVGADHTNRHAARAAVEQLESANARIVGSVLNKVDLVRNPYHYSAYYRKEYSRYYVKATH